MRAWLPIVHLVLVAVVLVWDVVLCGRIAKLREAPRPFAAVTALAGLTLWPGVLVYLATSSVVTGRAVRTVDWLWPVVLVLFAVQAAYALVRRVVNPTWGVPIAVYDLLIAVVGVARYAAGRGLVLPNGFLVLLAAQSGALSLVTTPFALASPLYFLVPMVSPAFPALRGATAAFRAVMTAIAIWWLVLVGTQLPSAKKALASYAAGGTMRLTERPAGDFAIGVKLFPDLASPPPPPAIASDLALADTLGVDVVSLVIVPDAPNAVLDSVSHTLDEMRRDSTVLIVSLGYHGKVLPESRPVPLDEAQRLQAIRRVVARLQPDILLPAEDPYGVGARLVGRLPLARWEAYLTQAAATAKRVNRNVRVGVSIAAFDSRDSALYAWAAGRGSPIDVVGFSFWPGRNGARRIESDTRAADRWMRGTPPIKDHWVFAAGGYPLAHGEGSQENAIWQALSWATAHPSIRGLVVSEAGDYGQQRGLRTPNGRLRAATFALLRALRGLREAAVRPAAPTR